MSTYNFMDVPLIPAKVYQPTDHKSIRKSDPKSLLLSAEIFFDRCLDRNSSRRNRVGRGAADIVGAFWSPRTQVHTREANGSSALPSTARTTASPLALRPYAIRSVIDGATLVSRKTGFSTKQRSTDNPRRTTCPEASRVLEISAGSPAAWCQQCASS